MIKINKLWENKDDQDMHGTKKCVGSKGADTEVEVPIGSTYSQRGIEHYRSKSPITSVQANATNEKSRVKREHRRR